MKRHVQWTRWQWGPAALLLFTIGCDGERVGAPAAELPPPAADVVAEEETGLVCLESKDGDVTCTLEAGSAVWQAPAHIRTDQPVEFELLGGAGGSWGSFAGGTGGRVEAKRVVGAGTAFGLVAGGRGGDAGTDETSGVGGSNGGGDGGLRTDGFRSPGGGGASHVSLGGTRVLVAGGGGGAGVNGGGHGGGTSGTDAPSAGGGKRGRQDGPGAGGVFDNASCPDNVGQSGSVGQGGHGPGTQTSVSVPDPTNPFQNLNLPCWPGAGGGGGLFGGGSGAAGERTLDGVDLLHGGGGGSGFASTSAGFTLLTFTSGNAGSGQLTITYAVHTAPPTVTIEVGAPVNKSGWYDAGSTETPGVPVNVTASGPDVKFIRCFNGSTQVLSVSTASGSFTLFDGMHSITCEASNGLVGAGPGSTEMPVLLNVDQTGPTLAPSISPLPVVLNGTHTASPNASDAVSGVASAACDDVVTTTVGPHTVSCTATDVAGNQTTVEHEYVVAYEFIGFLEPVSNEFLNQVKAGRTVPLKFSLNGDRGLEILASGSPASHEVACLLGKGEAEIEETVTAGSSGLSYDAATDVYTYAWKTEKSWAGSCRRLTLELIDGIARTATFEFTK